MTNGICRSIYSYRQVVFLCHTSLKIYGAKLIKIANTDIWNDTKSSNHSKKNRIGLMKKLREREKAQSKHATSSIDMVFFCRLWWCVGVFHDFYPFSHHFPYFATTVTTLLHWCEWSWSMTSSLTSYSMPSEIIISARILCTAHSIHQM